MQSSSDKKIPFKTSCKKIITLALPMTLGQFINIASGFLCMAMLATLGHDILAASALIFSTQLSLMVTGMSILFSLSVLVGHAYGAKDYLGVGTYVQQSWTLAVFISLPLMLIFWNIDAILIFFGQAKEIAHIVKAYFHAFIWAVLPGLLATCNMQFGYAIHKKLLVVVTSILGVLILLLSAYALIFGKWGLPKLGVAGLAYATVLQYGFFFIFTTLIFCYEKSFVPFKLFHYRAHQHLNHFIKMFQVGWPISIQMGGEMLSFFISGIMMGWLGITALAAFQIVNQYYFLIVIPIFALSQSSGILIGTASGAKQFHEVKQLSHASVGITFMASILVALLFLIFPKTLSAFYLDIQDPANQAILNLTIALFIVIAFSQIFDAIRNILMGILRGLFDTRVPMYISLVSIWIVGMPLSYWLAFPLKFGAVGFVIGGMLGMAIGMIMLLYRFAKLSKNY